MSSTPAIATSPTSPQSQRLMLGCQDLVPSHPKALWLIHQGIIRTLTWSESGKLITLGYWGPGDVVGQPLSHLNPYEIECMATVEVSLLPNHQWHHHLDAILNHSRQSEELLSIVHGDQVRLRLLQFLGWFARKFGHAVEQGYWIDMKLTHQAISEGIKATRVTVTRLLNDLEQEGVISRPNRHCILLRNQDAAIPNSSGS